MNTRFRLLFILLGALLVAATFSFPRWSYLLTRSDDAGVVEVFDSLAPALRAAFDALPPDQQAAYRARAAQNPDLALEMAAAALEPPVEVPPDEQALPSMSGPIEIASGSFTQLDPIRFASGDVIVYEQADDSKILRFENFSAINGPELQVVLSTHPQPVTAEDMRLNNAQVDLGALQGNVGAQNYTVPRELDMTSYNSIVLFSEGLNILYSVAPLD